MLDREQQLEKTLSVVASRETEYEAACVGYAEAEASYRIEYARAFLVADGTVEERKQTAIDKVERFLRARETAEAVRDFTREKLRDAQAAVSARQSLLAAELRTNRAFG